jgi:large subunit ribosomal protein L24
MSKSALKKAQDKKVRGLHVRTGDKVIVISGGGRSKEVRTVLGVLPREGKVIVEGVNVMKDSQSQKQQQRSGRQADINNQNYIEKPVPIDVSNVQLVDPKSGKPTRVKFQKSAEGKLERIAVKSGQAI